MRERLKKIAKDCTHAEFRDALALMLDNPDVVAYVHNLVYIEAQELSHFEVAELNQIAVGIWAACVHEWGKQPDSNWYRKLIGGIGLTGQRAYRAVTLAKKANLDEVIPVTREYLYWVIGQMQAESK